MLKSFHLGTLITMALSVSLASLASAQQAAGPRESKPRPTSQSISKKTSEKSSQSESKQTKIDTPQKAPPQEQQILSQSIFILSNSSSTSIPSGSVIYVPKHLENRVSDKLKGKLTTWKEFYYSNLNTIHLYPVNIKQARGLEKIPAASLKSFETMGKIIVATHDGGPISVAPKALIPEEQKN